MSDFLIIFASTNIHLTSLVGFKLRLMQSSCYLTGIRLGYGCSCHNACMFQLINDPGNYSRRSQLLTIPLLLQTRYSSHACVCSNNILKPALSRLISRRHFRPSDMFGLELTPKSYNE